MKPLYSTYSNGLQPYLRMAEDIRLKVRELNAGDCVHFCLSKPKAEKNFDIAIYSMIFTEIKEVIAKRPVIILDADHLLLKPIIDVFDNDFDVGAVYRSWCQNEYGRHDFCSGLVLLNNKRPDIIWKFCDEWLESMKSRPPSPGFCPQGLKDQGWTDTWFDDQTSLNNIITIETAVRHGVIYTVNGYRVNPLDWKHYTLPGKEALILHLKGGRKPKR